MGMPKHKPSRRRRGNRRAHKSLAPANLVSCPQCTEPMLPHRVCGHCGFYRGREVVKVEEKE